MGGSLTVIIEEEKSRTYQDVAGSLMASGYEKLGAQELLNDMYVTENWDGSQTAPTLSARNAGGDQRMPDKKNFQAVIQRESVYDARGNGDGNNAPTITGDHQNRVTDYSAIAVEECHDVVRRLTPMECERLQGFPDGWTDIGEWTDSKGKKRETLDSYRYKALGNSIALPFWKWLVKRISAQYERTPTLGSLFDGIGGFPLCWTRVNGTGSAIWASEIEEFCIAVTKKHFGDGESEGDVKEYL